MAVRKSLAYLPEFLLAVYGSWVSLVSGVGSTALLILIAFWGDQWAFLRDNKKTFVWLAIGCLILTAFVAWMKERQALEAEQAKNLRPKLGGWIHDISYPQGDNRVWIGVHLVNEVPVSTTISNFSLIVIPSCMMD